MNFQDIKWNKQTYKTFIKYLKSISDEKYKNFQSKLIKNTEINILGISVPKLRQIAKQISKTNYLKFISYNTHIYYEENMIYGLILGYIKEDNIFNLIDEFIPYIDNWAVCDTTCSNLKIYKKENIKQTEKYFKSENPWSIRFGLVLILNYFIEKQNLNYIYTLCNALNKDHYYVEMAIAWLLSYCYIKYPKSTLKYLKNNSLNNFTFNKTIDKICESLRVSKEEKTKLKKLKYK